MKDYKLKTNWNNILLQQDLRYKEPVQQMLDNFWPTVIWSVINVALWSQIVFIVIDRL